MDASGTQEWFKIDVLDREGLGEQELNGVPCFVGKVRFAKPNQRRQLFNPLVRFEDEKGNRFHVGGLVGALIAVHSAKLNEPVGVVCVPRSEGFEVVRFY